MGRTHTTKEGFQLEVYSSLYVDWGLTISLKGEELFTGPCCLSAESYGSKPAPQYEDWDEAEAASLDGDDDEAFVPWTDADWQECLANEAETLIEAYLGPDIWDTVVQNDAQLHNDPHKIEWLSGLVFAVEDDEDEVGQRRRVKVALGDDVALSIVAGCGLYSEPRGWAAWSEYTEVEVGIFHAGALTSPRSVGVTDESIIDLFETGGSPVAPYVPVGIVSKMAAAITIAQKEG